MAPTMSGLRAGDPTELERLLLRMSGGDEPAFAKLHAATRRKLFSTALQIVRRRHLAEEIVQEAYVRIWLNAAAYRSALGSPMMWMITIAKNLAIDSVRRPSREIYRDHSALLDFPADAPTALESMESRENESDTVRLQQSMLLALQMLDPKRRHLVIAAYLYGESRDRLAEQYGVPVSTIKTWLRRALLHVRAQIGGMPSSDHDIGLLESPSATSTPPTKQRVLAPDLHGVRSRPILRQGFGFKHTRPAALFDAEIFGFDEFASQSV